MTDYKALHAQLKALTEGIPYKIANLANASAVLNEALTDINWVGFYKMVDGQLILYPFQGKTACVRIQVGKGVCGTAVAEDKTQLVPNVHEFPGHIACDSASNSEIVVPIHVNGEIWGVLDIDSPLKNRFTEADRTGLEAFAEKQYVEYLKAHTEEALLWQISQRDGTGLTLLLDKLAHLLFQNYNLFLLMQH